MKRFAIMLAGFVLSGAALADPLPLSINVGNTPNDRSGDGLRTAFTKTMSAVNALAAARGQPGGIATLAGDGRLPIGQLPASGAFSALALSGPGSTGDVSGMSATLPEGTSTLGSAFASRQKVFRFDPRVYGATCNGSGIGDDTGIASALSAIQAAGRGALLVPGVCVISQPKQITGVPFALVGDGLAVSEIRGSATFPGGGQFLLRVSIMNGSTSTFTANGVAFKTLQAEVASGLEIEAIQSNLEERVNISNMEFRGVDPGAHGFKVGIRLRNVNTPKVSFVTVTGRQSSEGGPSSLTNMDVCYDIQNTQPGLTNYVFNNTRCNAAKRAYSLTGYMEGFYCGQCINVAVGFGWFLRPGQQTPLLSITSSHTDFFNAAVDVDRFTQSFFLGNVFYHRQDATANGVCYQMNGVKESQIIGGECVNFADATSLIGVVWNNSSDNIVGDMILSKVNTGIINQSGSNGNVYRRGRWINVLPGAGEHGNGGDNSNVCIGYNAAC